MFNCFIEYDLSPVVERLERMSVEKPTPLATKLGIASGSVLVTLKKPHDLVLDLPPNITLRSRLGRQADVIILFAREASDVEDRLDELAAAIYPSGGLWLAWPKKASGIITDLSDHVVRERALAHGLVDNKVCAIDGTWSGLRVVWRRADRTQGSLP